MSPPMVQSPTAVSVMETLVGSGVGVGACVGVAVGSAVGVAVTSGSAVGSLNVVAAVSVGSAVEALTGTAGLDVARHSTTQTSSTASSAMVSAAALIVRLRRARALRALSAFLDFFFGIVSSHKKTGGKRRGFPPSASCILRIFLSYYSAKSRDLQEKDLL